DPPEGDLLSDVTLLAQVELAVCDDFEDEAQAAAAQLLKHIDDGIVPVGLIAQDRSLVRRTCALLRRQGVAVNDETGWKLSTTRCGALIIGLLRSAGWRATNNQVLDWMKACDTPGTVLERRREVVDSLEASMRRHGWTRPTAVVPELLSDSARRLWTEFRRVTSGLADGGAATLSDWLQRLEAAQAAVGDWQWMTQDDVGLQAIHALRMDGGTGRPREWLTLASETRMALEDFTAFVSDVLELESFIPDTAPEMKSQVIVTPLPRAMLRQFAATVFPGVDEKRLAGPLLPHPLLSEQMLAALGLPTATDRRNAEAVAFAQVLRTPHLTLIRRRQDANEPLAASALVQRLEQTYIRLRGEALPQWEDPRSLVTLRRTEQVRPRPSANGLMPEALTASSIDALRDCPYKFFGTTLLGLREVEELEEALEKRDYGTWLHAVLFAFHKDRVPGQQSADEELNTILRMGRSEGLALGMDEAELVPYQASFELFAPRYIDWQRKRDSLGHVWSAGEQEIEAQIEGWGETKLRGRIDRVDRTNINGINSTEVIDYKSGSTDSLKAKANSGLEDTQLAVYGTLIQTQEEHVVSDRAVEGMYLSIDDKNGIAEVRHDKLGDTTRAFMQGVAVDLSRIRGGAPLSALGEGRTCDYCAVRGLCRRDHWAEEEAKT
ncbi:MAG TPA: PD-(D/E)XK nuclease family protein, partial [Albitalea sp.]|nr:PD-(D/E)XK nuclease family protein [Albitalea sp.]